MGQVRYQVLPDNTVEEIHTTVVHTFRLGDVEDPDLYAGGPLWDWQESDAGKFVMEHAKEQPIWQRQNDPLTYGWEYAILAKLEKKKLSEFYLRFGKVKL
jgi:hypothetical protein